MITSLHTLITHTHKPFLLDLIRVLLNILGSLISLMWVNRDVTIQQTSNQPMHPPHITHHHTSHTTTHHTPPHITHHHTSHTTTHHTLPHITHYHTSHYHTSHTTTHHTLPHITHHHTSHTTTHHTPPHITHYHTSHYHTSHTTTHHTHIPHPQTYRWASISGISPCLLLPLSATAALAIDSLNNVIRPSILHLQFVE